MGGSGGTKGHALSLCQPLQLSEAVNCGLTGPAEGRAANLHAGDDDQDGVALRTRRARKKHSPGRKASAKASCGAEDGRSRRVRPPQWIESGQTRAYPMAPPAAIILTC